MGELGYRSMNQIEVSGQIPTMATLPSSFTWVKALGTHWIRDWFGLRAVVNVTAKRKSTSSFSNVTIF
jgi:hypothetical protein